ncbi:IPT/TIG domain-containing protein [Nocardia sp. NBC_01009]|uniref:IPT/TIG domain-containing protein n=1 Tax=Nocardia sp. NBC_01009 TaxID=2975996 RepID=UPI00386E3B02|nr:IPT/TIG domain-containing protein [Nocardia sp. NBC_01009]
MSMLEITKLSTDEALVSGGTEVIVTGWGFQGASRVFFEDQNSKQYDVQKYTVDSDSRITLVSPDTKGTTGKFDIFVVGGKESTVSKVHGVVPDGDGMRSTRTFGVTRTMVPSRAAEIYVRDRLLADILWDDFIRAQQEPFSL